MGPVGAKEGKGGVLGCRYRPPWLPRKNPGVLVGFRIRKLLPIPSFIFQESITGTATGTDADFNVWEFDRSCLRNRR